MKDTNKTALALLLCAAATGCNSKPIEYSDSTDAGDPTTHSSTEVKSTTAEGGARTTGTESTSASESQPAPTSSGETTTVAVNETGDETNQETGDPGDTSETGESGTEDTCDHSALDATDETTGETTSAATDDTTDVVEPELEDEFVSELPGAGGSQWGEPGGGSVNGSSPSPATPTAVSPGATTPPASGAGQGESSDGVDGSGQLAVTEADILLRNQDTVYALSYYAGLSIVDVSDPADLRLLGSQRFEETPFEMYLDGDEVVVLFYGDGEYTYDEQKGYGYEIKSPIRAYNVANPSQIVLAASTEVEGALLDSRKVGDRLYVAASDYGYCWYCSDMGGARVASFSLVGDDVRKVGSLEIPREGQWGYSATIYANDQRIYVASSEQGYVDAEGHPVSSDIVYGSPNPNQDAGGSSTQMFAEGDTATTVVATATATTTAGGLVATTGTASADEPTADTPPADNADAGAVAVGDGGSSGADSYSYTTWSTLNVVDITDTSGAISLGAAVHVDGQINNRWQMDESGGILRVVAQRGWWGEAPVVDTFTVTSSSVITALGSMTLQLPQSESLRSVRFDGTRAYVVTFEQIDPLFTVDLSDPAHPQQKAALEMPGFLYHMLPRGDRLYAIGYDWNNGNSLNASVFDVADLDHPILLSKVNFGNAWGSFAEDQDRIEKSLTMLDEQNLMLIPFSGYSYDESCGYYGRYESGIQIIDATHDRLTLRGVAPAVGFARRAFYHRDHLFGYSDQALQSYDISDRDNPVTVDTLVFTRAVESVTVVGDNLVRIGENGLNEVVLDVTSAVAPNAPLATSALVLPGDSACGYAYYGQPMTRDGIVYVPRYSWDYNSSSNAVQLVAVDVRDASTPSILSVVDVAAGASSNSSFNTSWLQTENAIIGVLSTESYEYFSDSGQADDEVPMMGVSTLTSVASAASVTGIPATSDVTASELVTSELVNSDAGTKAESVEMDSYYGGRYEYSRSVVLKVIDVRDPDQGITVGAVDVPQEWVDNGFGERLNDANLLSVVQGYSNVPTLVAGGHVIASQHREATDDNSGVRYFADRLDVSEPSAPLWMPSANVPGQMVALAADDIHALTLEPVTLPITEAECVQDYSDYLRCYNRALELSGVTLGQDRAVRTGKVRLGTTRQWRQMFTAYDGVYVEAYDNTSNSYTIDAYDYGATDRGSLTYDATQYYVDLVGVGSRVGLMTNNDTLALLSTSSGSLSEAGVSHDVTYWCGKWELSGSTAFCAAGYNGVVTVNFQ